MEKYLKIVDNRNIIELRSIIFRLERGPHEMGRAEGSQELYCCHHAMKNSIKLDKKAQLCG